MIVSTMLVCRCRECESDTTSLAHSLLEVYSGYPAVSNPISELYVSTEFYGSSECNKWATSAASAEATHVYGIRILFFFGTEADVSSIESASPTPLLSCDWEPIIRALTCLPELRRLIMFFQTGVPYDDLVKFKEVSRNNLREDVSVELVHNLNRKTHYTVIDFDTLKPGMFSPWLLLLLPLS